VLNKLGNHREQGIVLVISSATACAEFDENSWQMIKARKYFWRKSGTNGEGQNNTHYSCV